MEVKPLFAAAVLGLVGSRVGHGALDLILREVRAADVANLRRCLRKDKPEKMNETEEANLRQAKSQLEASANHLMVLYASEQSENGSDGTI